jgi:hypothetical protein
MSTQRTHNFPLAPGAASCLILLGSLAVPASAQQPVQRRIALERHFTVAPHALSPVVFQTEPDAACDLHLAGVNDPAQTMKLYANIEGYVQFHFTPAEDAQDVQLQLDCATADAVTTHPVHLRIGSSPTADMPASETSFPAPKGSTVLAALTDESARQLSDQEILARGYSPRPDATGSREAYALWLATFSRPITMLPQHSGSQSVVYHSPHTIEAGPGASQNWSGYVANGTPGSYLLVQGWWNVPEIVGAEAGHQSSALWVGLDGYFLKDLVQAGTEQDVLDQPSGTTYNYYAWTEVVPNQPEQQRFNVNPGDTMTVQVWVGDATGDPTLSGNTAWFWVEDFTTNTGAKYSTPLDGATKGTAFLGSTAEWIMERPCLANCKLAPSSWALADLADYSNATMYYAWVATPTGTVIPYAKAENVRLNMYENYIAYPDNNWLSTVYGTSNNEKMQFFWKTYH